MVLDYPCNVLMLLPCLKVSLQTMIEAGLAGIMPDYIRQVWVARLQFPGQEGLDSHYSTPHYEVRFYKDAPPAGQTWLKAFHQAHKWFWMKQFLLSKISKNAVCKNPQIPGHIPQPIIDLSAKIVPAMCSACEPALPELTVTELQFLAVLKQCIQEDDAGCGDMITLPVCGEGLQLGCLLRQAARGVRFLCLAYNDVLIITSVHRHHIITF